MTEPKNAKTSGDLDPRGFIRFKGWAVPGPIPDFDSEIEAHLRDGDSTTLDAISGHYKIFQLKEGHRFSTDDILVAWYGTTHAPSARTVLDLGSGIGSVALVNAWRLPGARITTIEAQSMSVGLARRSVAYNDLTDRFTILEGDFRTELPAMKFGDPAHSPYDLITGSPPYFPLGTGVLGDHEQKIACRFEVRGTVADYCAAAVEHLGPSGIFACVFPHEQRDRVEDGARESGLLITRRRPVVLREGDDPLLELYIMMRATDLPERARALSVTEEPLLIRKQDGSIHPEYSLIKMSIGFPP